MKRIGLIGYGELGQQVEKFIIHKYIKPEIFYFDDYLHKKKNKNSFTFGSYTQSRFSGLLFFVCLGYKHLNEKKEIIKKLTAKGRNLPSLVHDTAYISPDAKVGKGSIIYPMSNIDKNTIIGSGVIVNNSSVISHDNKIGDCCYISPGVVTSGFVRINDCCFIGSGAVISNNVTISKGCTIGAGTVVAKNVSAGKSAVGNPMKILNKKLIIT
jgi:sugar O-acyltransferase (sialic acid O-acetyltransferase NeuD family)